MEELREDLDKLQNKVDDVESAAVVTPSELNQEQDKRNDEFTRQVLTEAGTSPKAALLLLSSELERNIRELLQTTGWHKGRANVPLREGLARLSEVLPGQFSDAFELFLNVRNRLAHGYNVLDDDIFRAIDSGLKLLASVQSVPREYHKVHAIDLPLYSDKECKSEISGVKGIMLETIGPGGAIRYQIYPTTQTHFKIGEQVSWDWNLTKVWGRAWFRHPNTNEICRAWESAGEFVGRPIHQ